MEEGKVYIREEYLKISCRVNCIFLRSQARKMSERSPYWHNSSTTSHGRCFTVTPIKPTCRNARGGQIEMPILKHFRQPYNKERSNIIHHYHTKFSLFPRRSIVSASRKNSSRSCVDAPLRNIFTARRTSPSDDECKAK